ncbi:helix-turn-helix domain-containing protein [Sedimentimonas flavescens]|uniref:helix-turn-helix domain-containing protein n=1 Tax=Sedimentimonas flavescens TaxID=2851012 RepID=UPI0021A2ECE1|nr:AraC family transcriptional regulator [Sedimentimonas flavescens]
MNIIELKHLVSALDRMTSPSVVDRALRSAGVSRKVLREVSGFLPYAIEAIVLEKVARAVGDRHLGARLGNAFDYSAYGPYADYVLGAPTLVSALFRSQQALPLLHPGSSIRTSAQDGKILISFCSGLSSVVGHRHLDEGAILVVCHAIRHFLGDDWAPEWIELTGAPHARLHDMETLIGAPIRTGADMSALALRMEDLMRPNPQPVVGGARLLIDDLPALMGLSPLRSVADTVDNFLRLQLIAGDTSEDGVARMLSVGPRTLQRALRAEGTSFREVKARFNEERARKYLSDSDLSIDQIAGLLGYEEPNSFRRAFRNWTGQSPGAYRDAGKKVPALGPGVARAQ